MNQDPDGHPWFDQWRTAKGEPLNRLVRHVTALVDQHERDAGTRQRQRRPVDQAHYLARVEIVVANLAHAVLFPPRHGRLAVITRNPDKGWTRYDNPALRKPFRVFMNVMAAMGLLDYQQSPRCRGEAPTIAPTGRFRDLVGSFGASTADFGRDAKEEVIILRRKVRDQAEVSLDYNDTRDTRKARSQMHGINAFLATSDIVFLGDGGPPVDASDRAQRRVFIVRKEPKISFNRCGRLAGGFWSNMDRHRRDHIRINGESVAILDFGQMYTRLAYATLNETPPDGDLYAISGLEGYRSGVKMAMNTLLFDTSVRHEWPLGMAVGIGNDAEAAHGADAMPGIKGRLPLGTTVGRFRNAALDRHPALGAAWGRGLGDFLMYTESEILVAVLVELMDRSIPALGLHDGLMVQASAALVAREVMERKAREIGGCEIPVAVKDIAA